MLSLPVVIEGHWRPGVKELFDTKCGDNLITIGWHALEPIGESRSQSDRVAFRIGITELTAVIIYGVIGIFQNVARQNGNDIFAWIDRSPCNQVAQSGQRHG